jgi:hypothetical protein
MLAARPRGPRACAPHCAPAPQRLTPHPPPSRPPKTQVSCTEPYEWKDPTEAEWEFNGNAPTLAGGKQFTVVAYDFGIKHNILRRLASFGCKIVVVPATYPADKVLALNPDGVFFSNGPVSGRGGLGPRCGMWAWDGAGLRLPGAVCAQSGLGAGRCDAGAAWRGRGPPPFPQLHAAAARARPHPRAPRRPSPHPRATPARRRTRSTTPRRSSGRSPCSASAWATRC